MSFYIYEEGKTREVSESESEAWATLEKDNYEIEDYAVLIDGDQNSIGTMYTGAVDKDEEVLPFKLFYFKDIVQIKDDGLQCDHDNDLIEHFAAFERSNGGTYKND